MAALQQRLLQLVHKFDAMGVATMLQGLVACGTPPSVELQAVLAGHIKKGLARPSQVRESGFVSVLCALLSQHSQQRLPDVACGATKWTLLMPAWLLHPLISVTSLWLTSSAEQLSTTIILLCSLFALQGMGATPVWLCLDSLLVMQQPPSPLLLDELLHQVAQQLRRNGTVSSSKMARTLLPRLAAAITAGGVWGAASGYTPSPAFCGALCGATLEDPCRLPPLLWLDLLVRFGDLAAGSSGLGFKPSEAWCAAATQQVFNGWGVQQQWAGAPAVQLAALLGAVGRLQHVPGHLPGWPDQALQRLSQVLPQLDGHQVSVALLGVAQQRAMTEMAAAAAAAAAAQGSGMLGGSYLISSLSSISSTGTASGSSADSSRDDVLKDSSSSSSSSSSFLQGFEAARPQLLAATEAATLPQLSSMDGNDLAVLAHALQQLGGSPTPPWVATWSAAAALQLPGMSGQACVLILSAAASFQTRPDPTWVHLVLQHCQQQLPSLQLQELLALARSLQLLGYRLDEAVALRLARAGQARAAAPTAAAVTLGVAGVGSGVSEESWEAAARQGACLELQQLLAHVSVGT
jgi:hypothetical protein